MDPRARWQALQAHLSAARFAIKMGDRDNARDEVETALAIDPEFLAARMLRDQLSQPASTSTAVPPAVSAPARAAAPPSIASLAASTATLAQFEARVKERVRNRAAAPPVPPAIPPRRDVPAKTVGVGALVVAAASFLVAMSSATVHGPRTLYSRGMAAAAPLVDARVPGPLVLSTPLEDEVVAPVARPFRRPVSIAVPAQVQRVSPLPLPPAAPPPTVQAVPTSGIVTDSPPPALVPRTVDERAQVEETLSRYRRAYDRLDARSAQAVYPAVNAAALAHEFAGLQSQSLVFDECVIDIRGASAAVTCRGTSRYVPRIGNRDMRVEPRAWAFTLRKDRGNWKIESARAGR